MNANEHIKVYLKNKYTQNQSSFLQIKESHQLFKNLYIQLVNFNFTNYEIEILNELTTNCTEWWTNTKTGVKSNEPLDAILFEHDWEVCTKNVEANAYGIVKWRDTGIYKEEFDMGFDYDFATEFESHPGITLKLFDYLAELDPSMLPDELVEKDLHEYPGYNELIKVYKLANYITVQKAIEKFAQTREFKKINKKSQFLFILEEHDGAYAFPLWNYEEKSKKKFWPFKK